jgi:hypothetical protein
MTLPTFHRRSRFGALLAFRSHRSDRDDGWMDVLDGMTL